jgi:hypothetical protein
MATDQPVLVQKHYASSTVTLGMGARFGVASYEENFSSEFDLASEWDGAFGGVDGVLQFDVEPGVVLRGVGRIWSSTEETEEWRASGVLDQKNDMQVSGFDLLGEIGWRMFETNGLQITPFVGGGIRYQKYERKDAEVFSAALVPWDSAEEEVDIAHLNLAIEAAGNVSDKLYGGLRISLALVFYSEAYNDLIDVEVEGDGGVILEAGGYLAWRVADGQEIRVGAGYEFQDLQGDTENVLGFDETFSIVSGTLEWPDNELERLWGELSWRMEL